MSICSFQTKNRSSNEWIHIPSKFSLWPSRTKTTLRVTRPSIFVQNTPNLTILTRNNLDTIHCNFSSPRIGTVTKFGTETHIRIVLSTIENLSVTNLFRSREDLPAALHLYRGSRPVSSAKSRFVLLRVVLMRGAERICLWRIDIRLHFCWMSLRADASRPSILVNFEDVCCFCSICLEMACSKLFSFFIRRYIGLDAG